MNKKYKRLPKNPVELFNKLSPENRVKLFMKYVDQPTDFYQLVAILGTQIFTNQKILEEMSNEYKKIRDQIIKQTDECWRKQLDFFQKLIDFHLENIGKLNSVKRAK